MSNEKIASMKRIAAMIYCRSISSEFRRPVDSMYPEIIESYLTMVKTPMDLGTILYQCIQELISPSQLREYLHLVFNNAITFNAGTPLMESVSTHIDAFAGGLFEEALNMPYREIPAVTETKPLKMSTVTTLAFPYVTEFRLLRLGRRRFRLSCVQDMLMNESEVVMCLKAVNSVVHNNPSKTSVFASVIKKLESILSEFQIYKESINTMNGLSSSSSSSSSFPISPPVSLSIKSLFGEIIRSTCGVLSSTTSHSGYNTQPDLSQPALLTILNDRKNTAGSGSRSGMEDDPSSLISNANIYSQHVEFIEYLDNALGELVVCMQERLLRGCRWSSIWACPQRVIWAQPASTKQSGGSAKDRQKTFWWTGIIVGGTKGTDFPIAINDVNSTRIPSSFANHLLRSKPVSNKAVKGLQQDTTTVGNSSGSSSSGGVIANTSTGSSTSTDTTINFSSDAVEGKHSPHHDSSAVRTTPSNLATATITTTTTTTATVVGSSSHSISKLPPMYSKYIPPPAYLQPKYEKMKYASGTSSLSYGAEQKYLVEFFGAHDFAWVKSDSVIPFSFTCPGPRGCSQDAVQEAYDVYKWIKNRSAYGIPSQMGSETVQENDITIANAMNIEDDIEDSDIELPLLRELEDSIHHPPRPEVNYVGPPVPKEPTKRRTSLLDRDINSSPLVEDMLTGVENQNHGSSSSSSSSSNSNSSNNIFSTMFPKFSSLSGSDNESKKTRALARTHIVALWMNVHKPIIADIPDGQAHKTGAKATKGTKTQKSKEVAVASMLASSVANTTTASTITNTSTTTNIGSFNAVTMMQQSPFAAILSLADAATKAAAQEESRPVDLDSLLSLPPPVAPKKRHPTESMKAPDKSISPATAEEGQDDNGNNNGNGNMNEYTTDSKSISHPAKRIKSETNNGKSDSIDSSHPNKKHNNGATVVCNISTPSARIYAGEGILHSKIVDLNSSLFFYEDKRREKRKEILKEELVSIESELKKLQNASIEREKQKEKFLQSRNTIGSNSGLSINSNLPTSSTSSTGSGPASGSGGSGGPSPAADSFAAVAMTYKVIAKNPGTGV